MSSLKKKKNLLTLGKTKSCVGGKKKKVIMDYIASGVNNVFMVIIM